MHPDGGLCDPTGVTPADRAALRQQLQLHGVVLVRGAFPAGALAALRTAISAAFDAVEAGRAPGLAQPYGFSPFSHSLRLPVLLHFGCSGPEDLLVPLAGAGLDDLFTAALNIPLACDLQHSWARKRYAPATAPPQHHPNSWHQDGGLGADFTLGVAAPLARLLTCWLPLDPCGRDRPGLEFVRHPLHQLLPYTELDDALLRLRFTPEAFWAPELEPGDGLVFLPGTLHRTYAQPHMRRNRLSMEYRLFPA